MENNKDLIKAIDNLTEKSFGEGKHFIVDEDHDLPAGVVLRYALCLTDITGFSATDLSLADGSGAFPTALVAGIELPSNFQDITVTGGSILCVYK